MEGSGFRDLYDQYEALNAKIVGVSLDTPQDNARFAEKYRFPFPLIGDTERKIAAAYGAVDSPRDEFARRIAYVIDENGRIVQAHDKIDARAYPLEQIQALQPHKI